MRNRNGWSWWGRFGVESLKRGKKGEYDREYLGR
jgi:hypothetical protein